MSDGQQKTVLVTGFGPFSGHDVNVSWVSVQELNKLGVGDDVNLIIKEIPVEYQTVQTLVPQLWQHHQPHLVVHVGVSEYVGAITLEQRAYNTGYDSPDIQGQYPAGYTCKQGAASEYLTTGIDVEGISKYVNGLPLNAKTVVSCADRGRYLCDFIYYQSLMINPDSTLFIHIPPLNSPYSADDMAMTLQHIIQYVLVNLL